MPLAVLPGTEGAQIGIGGVAVPARPTSSRKGRAGPPTQGLWRAGRYHHGPFGIFNFPNGPWFVASVRPPRQRDDGHERGLVTKLDAIALAGEERA